ncbi:(2Fe-2S)-binding protein [Amycolatopsis endophytica]|uniref:Carbon-monoxide dehydrogenase small subunit n=1 Tax=Amycolatopsis endophytica TaxID=860233 RepID=A0A853B1W6_9PSEU|nr:(2Fe-2S)-binding protein [Amycolatopsis endophytica]NYI88842.1 carbon-monoxide dehydrogenase small subunit [Amycolatopsis endophytica]
MTTSNDSAPHRRRITLTVNGRPEDVEITDGELLVDVLRHRLRLTGTHAGCYNGDCGACTVRVGGTIAKSCLLLAASVDGAAITTLEGFSGTEGLSELQQALWERDAFQCGFCIAGHVFALDDMLTRTPDPTESDVRDALIGNLCRCTGYVNLVEAVLDIAERRRELGAAEAG